MGVYSFTFDQEVANAADRRRVDKHWGAIKFRNTWVEARVKSYESKTSPVKGTPMEIFTLEIVAAWILDLENKPEYIDDLAGETTTHTLFATKNSIGFWAKWYKVFGYSIPSNGEEFIVDPTHFVDRTGAMLLNWETKVIGDKEYSANQLLDYRKSENPDPYPGLTRAEYEESGKAVSEEEDASEAAPF